jgi:hypothetical protein
MDTELEREMQRQHGTPATLRKLLRLMAVSGRDRLSFVRHTAPGVPSAVAIVLLGTQAIRNVGPGLIGVTQKLGDSEASIVIDNDSHIATVMCEMERAGSQWQFATRGSDLLFMIVIGDAACKEIAAVLNAHGCPTRLE